MRLCDLGRKERHKAATRNGVPQGIGRARHIPTQTDPTVGLLWTCRALLVFLQFGQ
ncbi:hypothetical protein [Veillonella sp. CHU110]|uniref:hypothetical protein n=1 Tax=Veillonella sp. CHU110 TaxID=2490947 RepID=UPI0013DFDE5A|nr:hypothetical protein [Veillonella sp. CHU110]